MSAVLISGAEVVAQALTWLGTPFHHAQILKGVGVDCAGLVIGVARELGLVAPDFDVPAYRKTPDGSMLALCERYMTRISHAMMRAGDVVVVAIESDPQHLCILYDYRPHVFGIIHAACRSDRTGSVIQSRLLWGRYFEFVSAYRLPGVA